MNFEKSLVFLTSNLGAKEMMREINPDFGFQSATVTGTRDDLSQKLQSIALVAVRKKFSPEFVNRIDSVLTYHPLDAGSLAAIVDHEVDILQRLTGQLDKAFAVDVPPAVRQWLMEKGTNAKYGARELKRTVDRHLIDPLADMVTAGVIEPGGCVRVGVGIDSLALVAEAPQPRAVPAELVKGAAAAADGNELGYLAPTTPTNYNWKGTTPPESTKELPN